MTSLGERLRDARTRANLTQQQLADAVGIDPTLVSHFEAGRREPSEEQTEKLRTAIRNATPSPCPAWTTTPEGRRASPEQRAAAMRSAIAWVERTGRRLTDVEEQLPQELRFQPWSEPLHAADVRELINLAIRLGSGGQTSEVLRAKREADRWVKEEGYRAGGLERELRMRWPQLPADEIKQLRGVAAYLQRMDAMEQQNRAAGTAASWVRSPEADGLTLDQVRDELEHRGLHTQQIASLMETARKRREIAGRLDEEAVAAITRGVREIEF